MRTIEQVKLEWSRRGVTITAWAKANGFSSDQVRDVLRRRAKGNFGVSHAVAVKLGLKDGVLDEATPPPFGAQS